MALDKRISELPSLATVASNDYIEVLDVSDLTDAPTGSNKKALASAIVSNLTGLTLWVDSVNGNDSTGTRGNAGKPYLTLSAACTAASSGDVIHVRPGSYTVTASLAKNGVNWHFDPGATVTMTGDNFNAMWDDGGNSMTYAVTGAGTFTRSITDGAVATRLVAVTNAGSSVAIEGLDLSAIASATGAAQTFVIYQTGGELSLRCRDIFGLTGSGCVGIWWANGRAGIVGRRITSDGVCVYCSVTSTPTGDLNTYFDDYDCLAGYPVADQSTNTVAAAWITGNTFRSGLQAVNASGTVRLYIAAKKIFGQISFDGSGLLYVRADKISAADQFAPLLNQVGAGQAWITVTDWDTTGLTTNWANVSSGTLDLVGGIVRTATGADGLAIDGGTCRLHETTIDTSANSSGNPINKTGGTLILENCTLLAEGTRDAITAGSAQTVIVRGTLTTNRPFHTNVTITGGPVVRSDASTSTFQGGVAVTTSTMAVGTIAENTTTPGVYLSIISSTPRLLLSAGGTGNNFEIDMPSDGVARWLFPGVIFSYLDNTNGRFTIGADLGIGFTNQATGARCYILDAPTNRPALRVARNATSQTSPQIQVEIKSSTTIREAVGEYGDWVDSTDATRKARWRKTVWDAAGEREAIWSESDGANALTGLAGVVTADTRLTVPGTALGSKVLRLTTPATNDDPTWDVRQNRVATTDASVTTLDTIAIAPSKTYLIESRVLARRTGGSAGTADDGAVYIRRAMVTTKAGTVTISAVQDGLTQEDQAAWDCTFTVSGTNILLRVTGAANNNVTWHSTTTVQEVGT